MTDIKREWHLIDVNGQILGRAATDIAEKLMGKNKIYFTPNLDCGDYVVVTNSKKVKVTGKKATQKIYYKHTGHPGGFKQPTYEQEMKKDSRNIIIYAVKNMLPKNKLQQPRLERLKVFADEKHTYEDKFKNA